MTTDGQFLGPAGVVLLHRRRIDDARGSFERLLCAEDIRRHGHPGTFAQANRSVTLGPGTVRGMHMQLAPHAEWKVVTCTRGAVHDVVVDLRRGSAWFGRHVAVRLSGDRADSVIVPPGCAHGFQVLEGPAEMIYAHSHPYAPGAEFGVRADDPSLAIAWPLPIAARSGRDAGFPDLAAAWPGVEP
ncbi:MAG: dTDP-4-dehydrorhamnose 3,5-epimerase family protein [Planctomycetes bacterium]|nr:dTDP-4-dehydrorhamnose 3,5-epimerase family protein [Planctomycetota bacterium]